MRKCQVEGFHGLRDSEKIGVRSSYLMHLHTPLTIPAIPDQPAHEDHDSYHGKGYTGAFHHGSLKTGLMALPGVMWFGFKSVLEHVKQ